MRDTILIVDDVSLNREMLAYLFEDEYNVVEAGDGQEAIDYITSNKDNILVILLDLIMPQVDGFVVLDRLNNSGLMDSIPVILITGDDSIDTERKGYDLGAFDFIKKPFDAHVVRKRVKNAIELFEHKNHLETLVEKQTEKLKKQANELKENNYKIIDALSTVVEFRDLESGQHIQRIKGFTKILLEYVYKMYPEYEISDYLIDIISQAAAMHDVGKIAISDSILLKPGKLTTDEFDIMKTHTTRGCEILETISFISDKQYYKYCYEICQSHHERFDGRGYPQGLEGENIPISAQVVSIADVYDALVSERVYKKAYSYDEAYHMIINGECGMFNPKLIECFKLAKVDLENLAKSE